MGLQTGEQKREGAVMGEGRRVVLVVDNTVEAINDQVFGNRIKISAHRPGRGIRGASTSFDFLTTIFALSALLHTLSDPESFTSAVIIVSKPALAYAYGRRR